MTNTPGSPFEAVARSICATRNLSFIRYVGSGTFKATFEVRDALNVPLALKVYNANNSPERTQREIAAMVLCDHPHIGRLVAIDSHVDGEHRHTFSLEEFLAGGTLTSRIASNLRLSAEETHSLGTALIEGVIHIAERELVHRDLKPDNIMFRSATSAPVIVDFGLVRMLGAESLTHSHAMQGPGTPLFAPPEQLVNDKDLIDWRSDQFSLGIVLAICAIGTHPYQRAGDTESAAVDRVAKRDDPAPEFIAAANARGLPALIKMVAPWPVQRYRLARQLATAWSGQRPLSRPSSGEQLSPGGA